MQTPWFSLLWRRSSESLKRLEGRELLALVRPKAKQITTEEELQKLFSGKKKLRVKFGIDPTGAEVHLGHAVPIMLLRILQRAGHEIHFIIGDFTAQIGDPSGRADKRRELSEKDIARNMKTYAKQVAPLLDLRKAKVHKNSKWLSKLPLARFLRIVGAVSLGEVVQRDDFRERIKSGVGVSMREANYSSLMALDSIELKADIEVGAIDQLLNFMHTRDMMHASGARPETLLMTSLLEGTSGDGRKMSKSFDNYIALAASADTQFGLIMSIPDNLIRQYFVSFGDIFEHEIPELEAYIREKPLDAKKELGMLVVALIHGEKKALAAREAFEKKFSKHARSAAIDARALSVVSLAGTHTVLSALFEAFSGKRSKSELRRLIQQGAVRLVDPRGTRTVITSERHDVASGDVYEIGKQNQQFRFEKKGV